MRSKFDDLPPIEKKNSINSNLKLENDTGNNLVLFDYEKATHIPINIKDSDPYLLSGETTHKTKTKVYYKYKISKKEDCIYYITSTHHLSCFSPSPNPIVKIQKHRRILLGTDVILSNEYDDDLREYKNFIYGEVDCSKDIGEFKNQEEEDENCYARQIYYYRSCLRIDTKKSEIFLGSGKDCEIQERSLQPIHYRMFLKDGSWMIENLVPNGKVMVQVVKEEPIKLTNGMVFGNFNTKDCYEFFSGIFKVEIQ